VEGGGVVLEAERWLELRRFRGLRDAGLSISEIARETGLHRRTVRKYLNAESGQAPQRAAQPKRPLAVEPFAHVIDAWLRAELLLKGTVIHERLVQQYGFTGTYQRVKLYLQEARPRIAEELGIAPDQLAGLHRRFEVVPGAQAQVDWGDEGGILAHVGIPKVYSFHMVLSYSRDPFCCFTTSQDLAAIWGCHRRAFAHFGGVPAAIVYDRTKTVVRRHVAPGQAVPLHPEAVAFAGHYDFDIDVLAAYRPTGKGRVERQVTILRDHVLAGRGFASIEEMDAAFAAWVPHRRARTHRTHGEVIGVRAARDHAALRPLPARPYVVADRHLRHVGKDCLVAYAGNLYSVPAGGSGTDNWWRSVRPPPPSPSTPPPRIPLETPCWPATRGRWAAAPASSTRRTGTACQTGTPGRSPPATPRQHAAGTAARAARCRRCSPGPPPRRSPSKLVRCRSTTSSPAPAPSRPPPAPTS
jgi:transposase